jgi:biopolymer transport protein ExbD
MAFGKRSVFGGATGGGGTPEVALNLTALMDILSNILFFLMAAYAAQATEVENKEEMRLPSSTSQVRLQLQLTISITQQLVQVADAPVARIEKGKLVAEALDDEGTIPSLYDKLMSIKQRRDQAGREQAGEASGILLLADKETDADVVSKVLKTAGRAGFVNVRFGVVAQ